MVLRWQCTNSVGLAYCAASAMNMLNCTLMAPSVAVETTTTAQCPAIVNADSEWMYSNIMTISSTVQFRCPLWTRLSNTVCVHQFAVVDDADNVCAVCECHHLCLNSEWMWPVTVDCHELWIACGYANQDSVIKGTFGNDGTSCLWSGKTKIVFQKQGFASFSSNVFVQNLQVLPDGWQKSNPAFE